MEVDEGEYRRNKRKRKMEGIREKIKESLEKDKGKKK